MERISSNRSFGLLFFIVLALISIWPLIDSRPIRVWPIPFAIIFLILGLINSKLLGPLNKIWVKFGEILGRVIAPIVMAFVYFVIVTPIGLLMRMIGKDLLNTKFSKEKSYWIKREKNIGPMKRQF
jgi:predicted membrane metal-binding protein|tara:strand:+ start:1179 stop:1556 length:378 start_codon:yes stop_codon:yes gene_type:complete